MNNRENPATTAQKVKEENRDSPVPMVHRASAVLQVHRATYRPLPDLRVPRGRSENAALPAHKVSKDLKDLAASPENLVSMALQARMGPLGIVVSKETEEIGADPD